MIKKQIQMDDDDLICQFMIPAAAEALARCTSRWGVRTGVVIALAAPLFDAMATESLRERRRALGAMVDAHQRIFDEAGLFTLHGAGMFPMDRFEEARDAEEESLKAEDLFGLLVAENSGCSADGATAAEADEFLRLNPFAKFLAHHLANNITKIEVGPQGASFVVRSIQEDV